MSPPPQALLDALPVANRTTTPLVFDENGEARFRVDDLLAYRIQYLPGVATADIAEGALCDKDAAGTYALSESERDFIEMPMLYIEADWGPPPTGPGRLAALSALAEANYCGAGTGGGVLSLHPATGHIRLGHILPLPVEVADFLQIFSASLACGQSWLKQVRIFEAPSKDPYGSRV